MATTKTELQEAAEAAKDEFRQVLQYIYDAHNQGQKKKLVKDERVRECFDRFGVEYTT